MNTYRHIGDLLKKNRIRYLIGVFLLLVIAVLRLITPWVIGVLVDLIVAKKLTAQDMLKVATLILSVEAVIFGCRFLWRKLISGSARYIEAALREKLFVQFERLDANFFINHKTGDLMARATNDLTAIRRALSMGVVMVTDAIVISLATIGVMAVVISPRLTLFALIPLPIMAIIITLVGPIVQRRFKRVNEAFSSLSERARETFSGIRIVKTFVREEAFVDQFNIDNQNMLNRNLQLVRVFGLFFPLIQFVASTTLAIAVYFGGNSVLASQISLGEFVSFITYLGMLIWPFMAIGWVVNLLQHGLASLKRINQILDAEPTVSDGATNQDIKRLHGDIEFKNLSFCYPSNIIPTLKHLNFSIKRGQKLALLGPTGSGKTTLANLLLRLYNAPQGTIFIDGQDICTIPLSTLRKNIGYVPQNNFLFSQTIRQNIALTDETTKDKKIARYAKIASIGYEIDDLPAGYDTILGERGVNLSGGQKQRVSIARALIKNPEIVILDDALSAVDTKTEESILNQLKEELKDKTSIIISHRISTVSDADVIVVLNAGHIIQIGDHASLMAEKGYYRDLFLKQQLETRIAHYGDEA